MSDCIRKYDVFIPNTFKHNIKFNVEENEIISIIKEEYGVIYRLTSPNGKSYIGLSTDFKDRIRKYLCYDCKGQRGIYNALKLHKVENFEIDILGKCYKQETEESQQII